MKKYFIHGRPAGHPLHAKYGAAITNRFDFEDPYIRWHDKDLPAIVRYFAWIINSFAFVSLKKTVIITEGLRITLVLSRLLSFGRIKLIALVDDESPYFICSNYYSQLSKKVNSWAYNQYDGWICIGKMETELIKQIVVRHESIRTGFNGVSMPRMEKLLKQQYSPGSKRIVFIGNGPAKWRMWYKGVDLMLSAFSQLIKEGYDLYFDIGGEWDTEFLKKFYDPELCSGRLRFFGKVDPVVFLEGASLYLHVARGEAWGISVNEAMASGIIPIVSVWTGSRECVEQVSPDLVVDINKEEIVKKIKWFIGLDSGLKNLYSQKCREVVTAYTEEKAIEKFKSCYGELSRTLSFKAPNE
jgi:glycosyltransferase involved in cell wall biosynthesis